MTTPPTPPEKCPHCGERKKFDTITGCMFICETQWFAPNPTEGEGEFLSRCRSCYENELAALRAELNSAHELLDPHIARGGETVNDPVLSLPQRMGLISQMHARLRAELAEAKREREAIRHLLFPAGGDGDLAARLTEWITKAGENVAQNATLHAELASVHKHLADANRGTETASRANRLLADRVTALLARNATLRGALDGIKSELQSVIEWSYPGLADQSTAEGRWHVAASGFHEKWRSEIQTALDGSQATESTHTETPSGPPASTGP